MILSAIISISLFTWGVFFFIKTNFPKLQRYNLPPVWGCIVCAASFWGSIAYWLMSDPNWGEWIVVVGAVAGLNYFLAHYFEIEWVKKKEQSEAPIAEIQIIDKIHIMCEQSLSPDNFEKWIDVRDSLESTRSKLKSNGREQ